MRKIILLLVLIAAAVVPAVPYLIGTTVEQAVRAEHEEAARDAALSGFSIELLDYQRGLLSANATTRFSVPLPDDQGETLSLEMKHRISHIPQLDKQVIATVDSELVLGAKSAEVVAQLFKGQAPLTIKTRIFLDGHQEGSFFSPEASGQLKGKESVAVNWQGLSGSAWQSAGRDNITFNLNLPGITIKPLKGDGPLAGSETETEALPVTAAGSDRTDAITMKELRYQGKLQRGASGMWHGKANASISTISIDVSDNGMPLALLINDIGIKGEQDESKGLINANGAMTANTINVNGFLLSNAVYDISVKNIDADAMLAWQQTAQQMMQGKVNQENPLQPMAKHLPALFNAHPVIKLNDISVDSPLGRFAIKMDSRINGKWDEMMLQNPALIIPMLKVDLEANLPRAIVVSALKDQIRGAIMKQAALSGQELSAEEVEDMVEQTVEQQLGGMIAQGLVKEDAAQLQTRIQFAKGKLMVNGVDASAMVGGIM